MGSVCRTMKLDIQFFLCEELVTVYMDFYIEGDKVELDEVLVIDPHSTMSDEEVEQKAIEVLHERLNLNQEDDDYGY